MANKSVSIIAELTKNRDEFKEFALNKEYFDILVNSEQAKKCLEVILEIMDIIDFAKQADEQTKVSGQTTQPTQNIPLRELLEKSNPDIQVRWNNTKEPEPEKGNILRRIGKGLKSVIGTPEEK